MSDNYLGIEIGGTKLQLAQGTGQDDMLLDCVRDEVDVAAGASGILRQIESIASVLKCPHAIAAAGVGFGGPVQVDTGRTVKSHQIQGWDDFPLGDRLFELLGCPVFVENDCNAAALGEAVHGAGRGTDRVFYVTVGTGIGGGFVVHGQLDGSLRPAISEIGHLRPSVDAVSPEETVESIASGWGIAAWTRREAQNQTSSSARALKKACDGEIESLTTKQIGAMALHGNSIATAAIDRAAKTLGWAIAQVITLIAPEIVIVGGGVSLLGEPFFEPLRRYGKKYVFPPMLGSYSIVPAALDEEVVLHGAIQVAKQRHQAAC